MQPYRERLIPSLWTLLPVLLIIPASIIVFAPISMPAGIAVALVLFVGAIVGLLVGSPVVSIHGGELRAGRAHIPVALLGTATVHRGVDARRERGPGLDARAWLCIRGWVDPVVRIEVRDPDDPAPYWLVSSRHPEELAAALAAAREDEQS